MPVLYLATNRLTDDCYVGWTSQKPQRRWWRHRYEARNGSPLHFHRAIVKYGEAAFDWTVVQHFDSEAEAQVAEVEWIARLREYGVRLYNKNRGGNRGRTVPKRVMQKRGRDELEALWRAGRLRPDVVERVAAKHRGTKRSEEAKQRMREAAARRWAKPGAREERSEISRRVHAERRLQYSEQKRMVVEDLSASVIT